MTTKATRGPRRRTVVALAVVLAVIAAFVVRLVDIQVVNAASHVADSQAPDRLGVVRTLAGSRGAIVDENGTELATSVLVYDAQLDPLLINKIEQGLERGPKLDWEEASARIAEVLGETPEEIRTLVADAHEANPQSQYLPLATSLTTDQYVALRDLRLPYLWMPARSTRAYPNGAVAGNVIGFVGSDGAPLEGYELLQDECLAPVDGQQTYLRGKTGVIIPGSEKVTEPIDGGTLQLTINSDLNWYLQQMIAEEVTTQGALWGSVFVVEVATGKVRAAAEYPTVDPNEPGAANAADRGSRIFTHAFEPGSTFKAITAAAVMEAGGATPLSTVQAAGREVFPNGAVVNDFTPHGTLNYTLAGALIDSSNVAMSKFGTQISAEVRHDYLEAFGVGERSAIGFNGEPSGVLHPVSKWDNQSLYTTTFGQYFTVTTPQLASAYQTIANGGVKVPLRMIESCTKADGTVIEPESGEPERVIQEKTADQLALMLENVASQGSLAEQTAVPVFAAIR